MQYDDNNIFAKILKGEIPCDKVHESEYTLAFKDLHPKAPLHFLVIPKGSYATYDHFLNSASMPEVHDFFKCVKDLVDKYPSLKEGYKLNVNTGAKGGQEVPHFHLHLMGGWA